MARAKPGADGPRKRGRPSKATPETRARILDYLRRGLFAESAARLAGISERTFYEWLERSDAGDPEFAGFSAAVKRATDEAEDDALRRIREGSPGWQGSAWFLERRLRDRWHPPRVDTGPAAGTTVTVNMTGPAPKVVPDGGGSRPPDGDTDAGAVPPVE